MRFLLALLLAIPAVAEYEVGNRVRRSGDTMQGYLSFAAGYALSIAANAYAFSAAAAGFPLAGMYFNAAGFIELRGLDGTPLHGFAILGGNTYFNSTVSVNSNATLGFGAFEVNAGLLPFGVVVYNSGLTHFFTWEPTNGRMALDNLAASYTFDNGGDMRVAGQSIFTSTVTVQGNRFSVGTSSFSVHGGLTTFGNYTVSSINTQLVPTLGAHVTCTNCTRTYALCVATGTTIGQWREQGTGTGCY